MRRSVIRALMLLCFALPAIAQPVRVPTSFAQDAAPNGADLIAQMQSAVGDLGSAHLAFSGSVTAPDGTSNDISGQADVSSRDQRSHIVASVPVTVTDNGAQSTVQARQESIRIGRKEADRSAVDPSQSLDDATWQCTTIKHLPAGLYDPVAVPDNLQDISNLGPDRVAGVPVWHVTGTSVDQTNKDFERHDYYISQADFLPVKQSYIVTVDPGLQGRLMTLTITYSGFGEPARVSLPGACRKHTLDDTSPDSVVSPLDPLNSAEQLLLP